MSPSKTVDSAHLEAARRILEREERANPLSSVDMKRYRRLNKVAYIGLMVAALFGASWSVYGLLGGEPFWHVVGVYVRSTLIFVAMYGWMFVILIGLNMRLARRVQRRERLVASFGLADALEEPWRAERAKHRAVNTLTLLAGPAIWAFGVLFLTHALLVPRPASAELRHWYHYPLWAVALCALWSFVVGYMYLWVHRLRRSEERSRVIARLQAALGESGDGGGDEGVEVAGEVYEQIARIERAQISRERADSIQEFESAAAPPVISKSQVVRAAQARLEPAARLRVEDAIEALAQEAGEIGEADALRWRPVENEGLEIGYRIAPGARRIEVSALRPAAAREASGGGGER